MKSHRLVAFVCAGVLACGGGGGDDGDGGGDDDDDDTGVGPDAAPPGAGADAAPPAFCTPADCTGETICLDGSCVSAFGRTYTFSVPAITVTAQDPNGEAWDALGGAPDPFVLLFLNGAQVLATSERADIFTTSFADTADVVVPAGALFRLEAWDGDVSDHDAIIACEADPLTADFLRAGGLRCEGAGPTAGTTVDVAIQPR